MLSETERKILKLIKEHGKISRVDISRKTGLSKPVVSIVTSRLIKNGLIKEVGEGKSTKKREDVLFLIEKRKDKIQRMIQKEGYHVIRQDKHYRSW